MHIDAELGQPRGRSRPRASSPSAVKSSQRPASSASCRATTAPPPAGSSRRRSACTISPGGGHAGTRANSTHSTCPTTAHLTIPDPATFQRSWGRWPRHRSRRSSASTSSIATRCSGISGGCSAQRAEDAWQETFLRALRAYGRLEHGRHLRAWVFTIATNVALDELRVKKRTVPDADVEPVTELRRDAFRELEHLTGRPAADRARGGCAPLRLRPPLRPDRRRTRIVRGGRACRGVVRRPHA